MVGGGRKVGMKKNQSEGEGKGLGRVLEGNTSAYSHFVSRGSHLSGRKRVQYDAFGAAGTVIYSRKRVQMGVKTRPDAFAGQGSSSSSKTRVLRCLKRTKLCHFKSSTWLPLCVLKIVSKRGPKM